MSINSRILIVDDDETLCYLLKEELITEGFIVDVAYDGKFAIDKIKKNTFDLLLLDLEMKEISGEDVLKFVQDNYPSLQIIILTGKSEIRTAINCIKLGAYDFITKPYEFDELLIVIERALKHKNLIIKNSILSTRVAQNVPNTIIGDSIKMQEILNLSEKAAQSESSILLQGESGTGKELFAEYIHKSSIRNEKPLVAINCASLPDQLIESELFGYEKGAFTDAKSSKQGLVEIANGGTLFLDEIGELSLTIQPKLLRFLENGEYRRVGGTANLKSNVRIIGATNKDLAKETEMQNFRKDLLFRLNVITLTIPPLRERDSDVILLANYFIQKKTPLRSPKRLSSAAEKALREYNFPGNVRELEHIIERAIIFSEDDVIEEKDLNIPASTENIQSDDLSKIAGNKVLTLEEVENIFIARALNHFDWNRENTARALGISQKTLYSKIKKYDIK